MCTELQEGLVGAQGFGSGMSVSNKNTKKHTLCACAGEGGRQLGGIEDTVERSSSPRLVTDPRKFINIVLPQFLLYRRKRLQGMVSRVQNHHSPIIQPEPRASHLKISGWQGEDMARSNSFLARFFF